MRRLLIVLATLAALVAAPILLRRDSDVASAAAAQDRLVVLTPHNETIRMAFGEAFARWWRQHSGRSLYVDWRTPGGSAEIRRVIGSGYAAAKDSGHDGIGVDVLFGGGDYEFATQATAGRLGELQVFRSHPEWFAPTVVPETFTGERYYDKDRRWVGVCLSQFGICYNEDEIKRLALAPPRAWRDLADPRYAGRVALADPTMSGSVARAFEMILQQTMQEAVARGGEVPEVLLDKGWRDGLRLIQRIGANARYFTDSSSKIPRDVGQGDAAAGMCVDFYGRCTNEELRRADGGSRLQWVAPAGGTSLTVDPVAVFRGAPSQEIAQAFVEFCLSDGGQLLWNARPGTKFGPAGSSLRRLPVRRDLYQPEFLRDFADPEALPYQQSGDFEYRPAYTAGCLVALRTIVRAMCIESHDELQDAWQALSAAGFPAVATKLFEDMTSVERRRVIEAIGPLLAAGDKVAAARLSSALAEGFRDRYRRAAMLAREK